MSIDTGEGDTSNLLKEDKEPKLWVVKLLFCVLFLLGEREKKGQGQLLY